MKVPLAVPNLSGREAEYLQECIRTTFVSSAGPFVSAFEAAIAVAAGTDDAIVMSSGTVALQMSLEALGVGRGDLVIAPTLTFIASTNAIRHTGAEAWLMDVSPSTWTLDPGALAETLRSETVAYSGGRLHTATGLVVKAVMPVMIMGASQDLEALVGVAAEFGLRVVVDAAAAIGATSTSGDELGQTGVDAVCYSFNGNKTITSGGGGAVASADSQYVERLRHLITTGRVGRDYDHDIVAYNHRMTNVEAAIGLAQIEQLDQFLHRKREVADAYRSLSDRYPILSPFPTPATGTSAFWFSGVCHRGDDAATVDDFRGFMRDRDIDVRAFWKPVHLQEPYRDSPRSLTGVADALWQRIVPLPCSTGITDAELEFVLESADQFWTRVGT